MTHITTGMLCQCTHAHSSHEKKYKGNIYLLLKKHTYCNKQNVNSFWAGVTYTRSIFKKHRFELTIVFNCCVHWTIVFNFKPSFRDSLLDNENMNRHFVTKIWTLEIQLLLTMVSYIKNIAPYFRIFQQQLEQ